MRFPKCNRVREKAGREIRNLQLRWARELAFDPLLRACQKEARPVVQPLAKQLR